MAYYMEKVELYSDESDWSLEEETSVDNYHEGREDHWFGDQYESEYEENTHGEELEPDPPDRHQSYTHKRQTKPWCNETESKFSYEDESDQDVEFYHYKSPPRRDLKPHNHGVLAHRAQGYTTDTRRPKPQIGVSHSFYRCGPKLPLFSGQEDYLQWEDDMEEYFWSYKTLEKEKLSCALNGLRGQALKWWRKDANERLHYKEPRIRTWGELKWLMNEEYVPRQLPPRSYSKKTPQPLVKHTSISTSICKAKPATQAKLYPKRKDLAQEQQHPSLDPFQNDAKVSTPKDLIETLHSIDFAIESLKKLKIGSCAQKKSNQVPLAEAKLELVVPPKPKEEWSNNDLSPTSYVFQKSAIMHLSLPKVVEIGLGATKETGNIEYALLIKEETNNKPWKSVLHSLQIKEKPPDPTQRSPTSQNRGKVLDSQNRMKPNLLSLGAGNLVLRTKPFEEGGNDRLLDGRPSTNTQGLDSVVEFLAKYTKDKGETNFLGKHVEDKGETTFLDMFQLPKLNDSSITQAPEPHSRRSLQQPSPEDPEDIRSHIKTLRMLQNELRHEVDWYGFLIQSANSSKWNQPKQSSEPKVMDFRSWTFCAKALFATRPKIELHSPHQARPSPQSNWRLFLGFSWFQQAQDRSNPPSDPPDTLQTRRWSDPVLFKESPGHACFKGLQTYVWRPGDYLGHS